MQNIKIKTLFLLATLWIATVLAGCGGPRHSLAPIKTFDPDNKNIPEIPAQKENQIWDTTDMTFVYQVEKVLDLNWTGRKIGTLVGVAGRKQAENINRLDEVPNSSWFTHRHYHKPMSFEDLKRGPARNDGPDLTGTWTITEGKTEGGTPGFTIKDAKGDYYIIKFDATLFPEMGSAAENISSRILHACGYYVTQYNITYFDPAILQIGEDVEFEEDGFLRPMVEADLRKLISGQKLIEGKIRANATKWVDGKPLEVWYYKGRRKDDPNDLVFHEHRRELRGLRTISSWLNDADRRSANTLLVYSEDQKTGNKYNLHYLIDMGSTLGSNNKFPHAPKYGYEWLFDPRTIGLQWVSAGLWVKPWEFVTDHENPEYPSIGYFESEIFNPGAWYPTYPNPAFEYCTPRDAFWGAKIVMSFRDEHIRTLVEEGQLSDPSAEDYLIKTLIKRRDKIGRHWFDRINPLDKFRIEKIEKTLALSFQDLAVDGELEDADSTTYQYNIQFDSKSVRTGNTAQPTILLSDGNPGELDHIIAESGKKNEEEKVFTVSIWTNRKSKVSKKTDIHIYYPGYEKKARIIGLDREE